VSEPERFELRLGGNWDQGKYGTAHNTRTQYFPFTLKYRGRHFDFSASASYDRVESPNRVVLIEGTPNQITPVRRHVANRTTVASGVGDTRLKGRWYLVEDGGRHSFRPAIAPLFKVKIPTAGHDLGTGETDYGFGLQIDKDLAHFYLFGEATWTMIGNPPGEHFRDRPATKFGVGREVTPKIELDGEIDWRRAVVAGDPDAVELVGTLVYRLSHAAKIAPELVVGLTDGSPDIGVGVEVAYRFGRLHGWP